MWSEDGQPKRKPRSQSADLWGIRVRYAWYARWCVKANSYLLMRLHQTTELLEEAVGHKVDIEESDIKGEPPAAPDPDARLTEIETGIIFPLADSKETTVGRVDPVTGIKPDIDLTPVDGKRSISRRHARIRRDKGGGFSVIEDVGTMNGTFVNGVRLVAGRGAPVVAGDTVVFGTIQCRFETDGD